MSRVDQPVMARADEVRERILQATYDCVARWGLSKTTLEDAAREAGMSRATLYRYFPGGRDELISAVVGWEYTRFFTRLYEEVQSADSLEEVMERGLSFASRAIEEHAVLQRVLKTEPEVLLPQLTTKSRATQELVAAFLVPYLLRHRLAPGVDVIEAADFLARMVLSYIASPGRWDLQDPEQVARLVQAELLAGILPIGGGATAPASSPASGA
jgi:AcrR family transcriptional regulator